MVKTVLEDDYIKCRVLLQILVAGKKKVAGDIITLRFAEAHNLRSSGRVEFASEAIEIETTDQPKNDMDPAPYRAPKSRSRKKK